MMKAQVLLTNILAVAAISAIANTQPNGVTPFDNLRTTQAKSFSATASGESETTSGCEVTKFDGKVTIADSYYVVESELTDTTFPLVVNPSEQIKKTEIEDFDVTFKASFVDASDLTTAEVGGAQIGFALTSATSASYFCPGDPKGTWTALDPEKGTGTLSVTEDAECTLHVDYDGRVKKARFTIGGFKSEWVAVGAVANNSMAVLGSGSVKSLAGATYDIAAEVIVVTPPGGAAGKNIEFSEAQMDALRTQVGGDASAVAAKLSSSVAQENGLKPMDNFVLFGKIADKDVTAATKPVVKGAKAKTSGNIAIAIPALDVQEIAGVTVTYKLMGSATGADEPFTTKIKEADSVDGLEFDPKSEAQGCKYFKVVTTVNYGN